MTKKFLIFWTFALFLNLIIPSHALTINLAGKKLFYCFKVTIPGNYTINGQYLISGEEEENINFKVYDSHYDIILDLIKSPRNSFSIKANYTDSRISVCIEKIDRKPKVWTINWNMVKTFLTEAASSADVYRVEMQMTNLSNTLTRISTYFSSQQVREKLHTEVNYLSERYLDTCTFITIGVILIMSVFELYMVTTFFKIQEERRGLYKRRIDQSN